MRKHRLSRRDVLKGTGAVAAALPAAFATRVLAQAPAAEAITAQLVEAAKKEGKLSFYTAMDIPVAERFAKTFEARYPGHRRARRAVGLGAASISASNRSAAATSSPSTWSTARMRRTSSSGSATAGWRPTCPRRRRNTSRPRTAIRTAMHITTRDLALLARLQHQPGEGRGGAQELTPICSIPSGWARSSRRIRPTPAAS